MWKICAFYTKNTPYEKHSENLIKSLEKFNIPFDVVGIQNRGDWFSNMQYKPTFLKGMLEKHPTHSIVYIDVDAVVCRYPTYFNKLDDEQNVNIAVHVLDHTKFARKHCLPEMLSGTIFLKNSEETRKIVNEWIAECATNSQLWDQRALATVLKRHAYHLLPAEYVVIFDYMASVKNPVIKHFQASRESRRKLQAKSRGTTLGQPKRNPAVPRRVESNGTVKIRRIHK